MTFDARAFAETWVDAWNRHDLDAVLSLFADDIVFSSPLIARLGIADDGVVRGRAALRDYWSFGLSKAPNLHFELISVSEGIGMLVIGFRNEHGVERFEILKIADGLAIEGHGAYPAAGGARSIPTKTA